MDKIWRIVLFTGDILVFALVTIYGFASHNELGSAGVRMLTTFIPLLVGWFLIAPFVGVYKINYVLEPRQLWRPFWAMVLAGPMAGWIRGVWLDQVVLPIFVVVLGGVSALGILAWRAIFWFMWSRLRIQHG